ncbi:OmpH family outer membrane protein [Palleronia pelagia]|uniref:Chaperone for outer membrane proteins, Skp family n=1 Tax=Palleronia pelagia TaxID=387096 RepID=A0A1H8BYW5_9RHOB|nr:OmpH family outer membrane protein [Palleronia pelagia]SEM87922.1 chaperone for outer membrane proteins, Skp family [Palleronia pelagia]
MTVRRSSTSRFRPLSDLRAVALCLLGLAVLLAGPAASQSGAVPSDPGRLAVAVVDQERLFNDSQFGQRILAEIDRASTALAAENRRIEADLVAEERRLTDERPTLDPETFRARARDFDDRVTSLRQEQDAKLRAVGRLRDDARQVFYGRVGAILRDILAERGALVLLDRRAVLSVLDTADITDIAIARIDAVIGDGGDLPIEASQIDAQPSEAGEDAAPGPILPQDTTD